MTAEGDQKTITIRYREIQLEGRRKVSVGFSPDMDGTFIYLSDADGSETKLRISREAGDALQILLKMLVPPPRMEPGRNEG